MKKVLLLLMIVCGLSAFGQKKKPAAKPAATSKKTTLAKAENLSAEIFEKKNGLLFYALTGKDTLFSHPLPKDGAPTEVKVMAFSSGAAKLHGISWNQKKKVGDPKVKLENITESHTEIWDVTSKKRVFENTNSVNNITEVVWLDPNKTASKTVEKVRREGMECNLMPNGDVVLKNKSQETKYCYDAAGQKFAVKK